MSKNKKSDADAFFLFLISLALIAVFANRVVPKAWRFMQHHRYMVAGLVSMSVMGLWIFVRAKLVKKWQEREWQNRLLKPEGSDSIYLGSKTSGDPVYIPLSSRRMHAQVVGTTNAGKTESVILPWAISDIENGRGLILIDGKSDRSLLDKLYAYAVKNKRAKDFRLLSLVNISESSTFNPLVGGTPEEITERIFSSFMFEDEYYRNLQYEVLKHVLLMFDAAKVTPTFQRLIQAITDSEILLDIAKKVEMPFLLDWTEKFIKLNKDEREKRTSGLVTQLGHFATGEAAALFNSDVPQIDMEAVLREGLIVYCQLPVLRTPVLGKATGKMILQALQGAVSTRHLDQEKDMPFFGVYLDDFAEYLTPGFVSLLNKSRSANIGVTFAHQAQGDLAALGEDVKNTIMTNSNLKVFMRTNEPETAEYFARTLGTRQNLKLTDRMSRGVVGQERTGESSAREVEEFIHHPNLFKKDLGTGDAVLIVPLSEGSQAVQLKFDMREDLKAESLPRVAKLEAPLLKPLTKKAEGQKDIHASMAGAA